MLGIGNPLLDGNPRERPWEQHWAAAARAKQACGGLKPQQVAEAATHKTRGVLPVAMRDGHADLADVRSLAPRHEPMAQIRPLWTYHVVCPCRRAQ